MVAQRGQGVQAAAGRAPQAQQPRSDDGPKPAAKARPNAKPRLTFKEQHALATLPAKIEQLRAEKEKLQRLLDDASLYARDPAKFGEVSSAFANAETELAAAEEKWLELEIRREEIEG
jgi:ATP-binding cassette subfamily F protein uup